MVSTSEKSIDLLELEHNGKKAIHPDDYHAFPTLSFSKLKDFGENPQMFKAKWIDGEADFPDSDALDIGNLFHCMVLEPSELKKRFVVHPHTM